MRARTLGSRRIGLLRFSHLSPSGWCCTGVTPGLGKVCNWFRVTLRVWAIGSRVASSILSVTCGVSGSQLL
eukprot:5268310-Amphidinium_carterae.1